MQWSDDTTLPSRGLWLRPRLQTKITRLARHFELAPFSAADLESPNNTLPRNRPPTKSRLHSGLPTPETQRLQRFFEASCAPSTSSRDRAARLRERVAAIFPAATLGRWHDTPVGPHTQSMYQIAFPPPLLASFLPWLMLNRDGLSILLHRGTGDAVHPHKALGYRSPREFIAAHARP